MSVFPSLTYHNVDRALGELSAAFSLAAHVEHRDGETIRAATLRWRGGVVVLQPELPAELHGEHAGRGWVYVEVDDVDAHRARAVASGVVEVLNAPHDAFDGAQRGYSARDREGNLWSFGSIAPAPPLDEAPELVAGLAPCEGLLGEWVEQIGVPGVPPGRTTFEPVLGGRFVLQQSVIPDPVFPDSWMVVVPDHGRGGSSSTTSTPAVSPACTRWASTGGGGRCGHSADSTSPPFAQRFEALLSADGRRLAGRWESRRDGEDWQHDFDVTYTKVSEEQTL